ncbi:hypothetical protein [Streptococcus uberis]|uniref:Nmad3 family putative nucleotide modification protein n=1 Tax=Streptococcus uberis TaxID=1349 RepID=UPI0012B5E069|nr:hypothetical protein [Streptococcus uberis]MCK1211960.1 hypothetical protein [Streptococcus uberis]MCK1229473.1 hypothetical protein [Streptococcus uberis]MCK1239964.1 hypothetical protein [Streptococcus uberis]MTB42371.1 hypothetical protein [Streptococcus uberis]
MKIILSRKGFDSKAGGVPNPILPDGTLLSLPIPTKNDYCTYHDLQYDGVAYSEILSQLKPKDLKIRDWNCHLDPDIRPEVYPVLPEGWIAGFGQINHSQGYLRNQNIGIGDLFLFFGWFKQTEGNLCEGSLRYVKGAPDQHILYGYLQVGELVSEQDKLEEKFYWHPHSHPKRTTQKSNMLYLPTKELTFDKSRKGYGVFEFSENRILTKKGYSKAVWNEIDVLLPNNISKQVKNSAKKEGIYYAGQWQELVLKENKLSENWAKNLFT